MTPTGSPHHPRSSTRERRSPRADAHDPPVLKDEWQLAEAQPLDAFLEDVRARVGDDAAHERLLRHGGLHLDRRRLCDFDLPPDPVPAGTSVVAYWFSREPLPLELPPGCVLLDERGLVAIDKPPWWTTQGTRASRFASLERALRRELDCPALVPVNRIDRETTGVLLFARDSRAASEVGKQFVARTVLKEYIAVVEDRPDAPAEWEIRGRMIRVAHPSHSRFGMASAAPGTDPLDGDWSATRFAMAARGTPAALALVRAFPLTGRTHQIRVHLASAGLPIAGDSLYGVGWEPGHPLSSERMLLHARAVSLRIGGRETTIVAPPPSDFPAALLNQPP